MSTRNQRYKVEKLLAMEQAFQDRMIARRLPGWLGKLDSAQLEAAMGALEASLHHRQQLGVLLKALQPVDAFAKPALQDAMAQRYQRIVAIDQLYLRRWYYFFSHKPRVATGRWPQLDSDYYEIPLYQAALDNFTADEAAGHGIARRDGLFDASGKELGRNAVADFAGLCRRLDLGAAYQRHLDAVLDDGFRLQLANMLRQNMLVEAYRARAEGALSSQALALVRTLCGNQGRPRVQGVAGQARQLHLLGCDIQQVVVLDAPGEGILVYIPGDRHGAWHASTSLEIFITQVLAQRLMDPAYQRFFRRFVKHRDSQRFFAEHLRKAGQAQLRPISVALFEHLSVGWVRQIKDDAAMILTPTNQVDRVVQAQRDQRLKQEGWALVSLAGLFVPALGALVLAVTAWELLGEVFEGIEAWRDGDHSAALDHLGNVAKDVAVMAATGVAIGLAHRAWAGSTFVDGLVPARLQDGSEKLWKPNLEPFRCEPPAPGVEPDSLGIHAVGEHDVIEMDGHYYRVMQDSEGQGWQICPQNGHGPALRHNGAGAWRLWSEQPARWEDTYRMFRRLGAPFNLLDDTQIDQVLANQGLTGDDLRALHVYGRAADAELRDAVERSRLAVRMQQLISGLRAGGQPDEPAAMAYLQALPDAAGLHGPQLGELAWAKRRELLQQWYEDRQLMPSHAIETLQRAFPSLPVQVAYAVLRTASAADRQALQELGHISTGLARVARGSALRMRSARVIESLHIDTPQSLDLARVVLKLLEGMPGATEGLRWRLFDGDGVAPLLTTGGSGRTFELVHQQGLFRLHDALAVPIGQAGELFETLARAYRGEPRQTLGLAEPLPVTLRQALAHRVVEQRGQLPNLLGAGSQPRWWVAPQRLGRLIGYPLSCCPGWFDSFTFRPRSLAIRVADLYPDFDADEQIQQWLEQVQASGREVEAVLGSLEQQFRLLNRQLKAWVNEASSAKMRVARREFRDGVIDCWRYCVPEQVPATRLADGYRWSWTGQPIGALPPLPDDVEMPHVSVLEIENAGVESLPDEFLQAFPNVRSLELMSNRLRRLPALLPRLRRLQSIDLYDNQLELDPGQSTLLASCESLTYLNLSKNPLRATFSVHAMPHLADLRLRDTGIARLPHGVLESQELQALDVSHNRLTELPEGFYDCPVWRRGHVMLEGNNLSAVERNRLVDARAARQAGPAFSVPGNVPVRLLWVDLVDDAQRAPFALLWTSLEDLDSSDHFFDLLRELTQSADFNGVQREELAQRLMQMMQRMSSFDPLRDELFAAAQIETCGDGAAIHFSELEVRLLVWEAEHAAAGADQEQVLVRLARRLWRLSKLNGYARWDFRDRRGQLPQIEEIEVVLAYNIRLREALDLPVNTARMRFPAAAQVDERRAEVAGEWVCRHETDENVSNWMTQCRFWQRYLDKAHEQALRVPDHFRKQLALLRTEAEMQALQAVIDVELHERRLAITRSALQRAREEGARP